MVYKTVDMKKLTLFITLFLMNTPFFAQNERYIEIVQSEIVESLVKNVEIKIYRSQFDSDEMIPPASTGNYPPKSNKVESKAHLSFAALKTNLIRLKIPVYSTLGKDLDLISEYRNQQHDSNDTLLIVTTSNQEEFDKVKSILLSSSFASETHKVNYEDVNEVKLRYAISKMKINAQEEADVIGETLGRKVGNIISVSNSTQMNILQMNPEIMKIYAERILPESNENYTNAPFELIQKEIRTYSFRFELLLL